MPRPMTCVMSPVLLLVGTLSLGACTTTALAVAARDALAKSSNCPKDEVKVEELGDSKYRASGCMTTETYICRAPGATVVSCVPESSVKPLQ